MFLWPKMIEIVWAVVLVMYTDYNEDYSIFGTILSIGKF